MGNCFGMVGGAVHPWSYDELPTEKGGMRIKVKMTTAELKELVAQVDLRKGSSELGELILRELYRGRFEGRIVGCGDLLMAENGSVLSVIDEADEDKIL